LPEGSVSDEAIRYLLRGLEYELVYYKLITDVCLSTANGDTDFCVVPIENTIEGSVSAHLDFMIHDMDLPIQAEWVFPPKQNLIGFPGTDLATVEKVISHQVAIAQCREFLKAKLPDAEKEVVSSTVEGVRQVRQANNANWVGIGTELAASLHGLEVLASDIGDHDNNMTRFLLVGPKSLSDIPAGVQKTSILITLPEDYPGALHQVLSAFAWRRINLTRIESRPTRKQLGNYYFYIDIEESMDSVLLRGALNEIEAIGCELRVLGSYPSFNYSEV
jgi:prephenate dehydratase